MYFEYHCYEGEDSSDAELWHRTHQQVRVLSKVQCGDGDLVSAVYCVRFNDGFEGYAFGDELVTSPARFYRPDYVKVG